jgi:hypothetical protein
MKDVTNKDDLMLMSRHWFNEWDELERVTATNYYGIIKNAMNGQQRQFCTDSFGKSFPRMFAVVRNTLANDNQEGSVGPMFAYAAI